MLRRGDDPKRHGRIRGRGARGVAELDREAGSTAARALVPSCGRDYDRAVIHRQPGEVSRLLAAWGAGDSAALEKLLPLVYRELKGLARRQLRNERPDHTLQPTALVHEAFLRLVGSAPESYRSRSHFLAVAAGAMRRVLVDHARRRNTAKRGHLRARVPIEEANLVAPTRDLLELDLLLSELETVDDRAVRILEHRYFAGATIEETAESLGLSVATVFRETQFGLAWLRRRVEAPS